MSGDLPIPVFVQGYPPEIIERAETARLWYKAALTISQETPADAPDRELATANLEAAEREARNSRCLLEEFRGENP
jgi:hypothetical protein